MIRMIKVLIIAALVAAVAAPASARVRSKWRGFGAAPRQNQPVLPGTSTIPGRVFLSKAQKSLSSSSGK